MYIDGIHHDYADVAAKDAATNRCLADAGYTVIRFQKEQAAWPEVVRSNSWLFGEIVLRGRCMATITFYGAE